MEPTTAEQRAKWKAWAEEGEDGVEGTHDEIFLRLIAHVDTLEGELEKARRFLGDAIAAQKDAAQMIASLTATGHAGRKHKGEVKDCSYVPCCTWRRIYEGMATNRPAAHFLEGSK